MTDSVSASNASADGLSPEAAALSAAKILLHKARRVLASRAPCPSPCISVCRMSADSGWCEGCWRDLTELRDWGQASESDKRVVWQRIQERVRNAYPQVPR